MRVLAVNTASARLSIALVDGDRTIVQADIAEPRDQGNFLLHTITQGLKDNNLTFADLGLMVAVTGPGSFTGIRIGLAAMRGFALASGTKLAGVSSFDLYSQQAVTTEHTLVVMESWREELYFRLGQQAPMNVTPTDCAAYLAEQGIAAHDVTLVGDAAAKMQAVMPDAKLLDIQPTAHDLALLVQTHPDLCGAPDPFYLREADVSFGRANRTLKQHEG